MDKKINFLRFNFTVLQFVLLCVIWTFFIFFIWPVMVVSYFFVTLFVCFLCLVFAGIVTSKLLLGLIIMMFVSKKVVNFYINAMLLLTGVLGTWVFSWFVKMGTFVFFDHLVINTFTIFLYYKAAVQVSRDDDEVPQIPKNS